MSEESNSIIISKPVNSLAPVVDKPAEIDSEVADKVEQESKSPNENKKDLTEAERKELRAKKFGNQIETTKLEQRQKRFGAAGNTNEKPDDEALKKRAQRFGNTESNSAPSTPMATGKNDEQLKKRAQRFGNSTEEAPIAVGEVTEKISKRKERFGIVDEDSKKKQRGQRFAGNN